MSWVRTLYFAVGVCVRMGGRGGGLLPASGVGSLEAMNEESVGSGAWLLVSLVCLGQLLERTICSCVSV